MTTRYQRQWAELEVIKSIYEKEYEEIKFPWKVDHPPWFKINLSSGISLEIRMTATYPDSVPEIKANFKSENSNLSILTEKLRKLADSLVGSEMCFDLIEMTRSFGEEFCSPEGKISFHTEMLRRQEEMGRKAQDQQALQTQKMEEDLRRQRKAELEELERKIRDEVKEKIKISPAEAEDGKRQAIKTDEFLMARRSYELESPVMVEGLTVSHLNFEDSLNWPYGRCFKATPDKSTINCESLQLKLVPLQHPFLQTFGGRRQLEFLLKNVKNHPLNRNDNILRCFGGGLGGDEMFLLGEDFGVGGEGRFCALETILEQAGCLALDRVVDYLGQMCRGLAHMHAAGLTHRSLDLQTILIGPRQGLKITDYLVARCLQDLSREHEIVFSTSTPNGSESQLWLAPESVAKPGIHGKKVDVWALGRLAVQMLFGREALGCWPAAFDDLIKCAEGQSLPEPMKEFLRACLNKDSGKRVTAEDLVSSRLFAEKPERPILRIEAKSKPAVKEQTSKPTLLNQSTSASSRYLADFEELEFLGRGGFGSVVKVRNKIDDRFYAVKKIALDPRDVEYNKKILREVTTLSRLHHERIIRYYQAWIEDGSAAGESDYEESDGFDSTTKPLTKTPLDLSLGPKEFQPFKGLIDDDDEEMSFSDDESDVDGFDDFIQFEKPSNDFDDESGSEWTRSGSCNALESSNTMDSELKTSAASINLDGKKSQVLYIQMEYCPNQTLRDLIDERNSDPVGHYLDSAEIWRLFRQIIEGLVHIHAQGMMHRDLKPSNIFLDSNGDVKIGDFGLAVTRIESSNATGAVSNRSNTPLGHINNADKSLTGDTHTENIGTPFYVSPEQTVSAANSATNVRYNQKVDMYSLGIILIEFWVPFTTGMERLQCLSKCRLPEIALPPALQDDKVIEIARRLLCHDPKKRFSSLELLRSDLLPPMLEEEIMEDAVRSVAQPGAQHYPRLISTIFRRQNELDSAMVRPKDFAFDVHSGNATETGPFEEASRMRKDLERVFFRHGACEIAPPLFYLPLSPTGPQSYTVLDDSGQRLELPSNLTRPFARWVAQSSLQLKNGALRRFCVDRVFRKISQVSGGQPFQPLEAAFDVIHAEGERDLLTVCEVLRVLFDSIMAASGGRPDQFVFKFNHLALRGRLMRDLRADEENFFDNYEVFPGQSLTKLRTGAFDEKVMKVLTAGKADESAESLLVRLSSHFPDMKSTVFNELSQLLLHLQKLSVIPAKVKIVFDPLLACPRPDLYADDLYFVILRDNSLLEKRSKRQSGGSIFDLLACGGRYNQLIEEYKFPTARLEGKGPFAVGSSIFLEKLSVKVTNRSKFPLNYVINLHAGEPSADELVLIGEMWRLGRAGGLLVNHSHNATNSSNSATIYLQVKLSSGGRSIRIKWRTVEDVLIEDLGSKLKVIEDQIDSVEEVEDFGGPTSSDAVVSSSVTLAAATLESTHLESIESSVHYLLSNPKMERNPLLREKAGKAVKLANPAKSEIIVHDLPREVLKRFLHFEGTAGEPSTGKKSQNKMNEEERDQLARLSNLMQSRLNGKMILFVNHKDGHIESFYNNTFVDK